MTSQRPRPTEPTPVLRVVLLASAAAVATALFLVAFAYPATHQAPRDLPIAIAGPPAAAAQVDRRLNAHDDGAFNVVVVADRDAAVRRLLDRQAYGAVILGPTGPAEVLTASAASPVVAQLLRQLADGLAPSAPTPTLAVTDVAPTPGRGPTRSRSVGWSAPAHYRRHRRRHAHGARRPRTQAATAGCHVGGSARRVRRRHVAARLARFPPGQRRSRSGQHCPGGVATMALLLIAMHALLGRPGLVLTELTLVLLGNPLSAATSAPELLPTGWSAIGQWMPLGATVDLLRGVSGFDGRATAAPTLALAGWDDTRSHVAAGGRPPPPNEGSRRSAHVPSGSGLRHA
jgi:hypothetical protein